MLFTVFHVPIEEHAFFILQPIFLILLHSIFTLPYMIPYRVPQHIRDARPEDMMRTLMQSGGFRKVQTLRRRPRVAAFWLGLTILGFALLFWPTTARSQFTTPSNSTISLVNFLGRGISVNSKSHVFYLGAILAWICPVIAFLTRLGAHSLDLKGGRWTYIVGIGYLWMVDT